MRLFTRYVLREICQVFLVTLVALTTFMILVGAVQTAIAEGLGAAQILQALPFLLPGALMFAVPGTILFAVSNVYGRMSGTNELVALKSLGLSPMVVIWPALALATLLSFTTVWLNDLAMSWGYHGVQRVVVNAIEDIAYGILRTHKTYRSGGFSVTVRAIEGQTLVDPVFVLPGKEGEPPVEISAKSAQLRSEPGTGELTLELYHPTVDAPGVYGEYPGEVVEYKVTIKPGAGRADASPSRLALRDIPEALARQRGLIDGIQERITSRAGFGLALGDFDRLADKTYVEEAKNLEFQRFQLYKMQTEPPRRWANGFSCLCFALVGTCMAIRMRNADMLTSFFLCFLPILLVYYPLLMYGLDRAKAGEINPYVVWLANAILLLWGLWLLRRVLRY
jgi:lipopolysaccharide export system permease protein